LYYLKSRYYDAEIGRFINADGFEYLEPSIVDGLNLYAYCINNPVAHTDPNGTFIFTALAVAAKIALKIALKKAAKKAAVKAAKKLTAKALAKKAATGAVNGAITGAMTAAGSYLDTELIAFSATGEWQGSWGNFGRAVGWGALGGAVSGAIGSALSGGGAIRTATRMGVQAFSSMGIHVLRSEVTNSVPTPEQGALVLVGGAVAGFMPDGYEAVVASLGITLASIGLNLRNR